MEILVYSIVLENNSQSLAAMNCIFYHGKRTFGGKSICYSDGWVNNIIKDCNLVKV